MRLLVTGSSGHLGEALVATLAEEGHSPIGLDALPSPTTHIVGSIADRALVEQAMRGVDAVLHTATLHKPHVATHSAAAFVETNISGTLVLLEEAVAADVQAFVYTSTTSAFGDALVPPPSAPAVWITEQVSAVPKNIYGVTKCAAEDLCQLFHRNHGLPCIVLRTSRFFPEDDDNEARRNAYDSANLKTIELLYRRVDIADVVTAHTAALTRAAQIGFDRFVVSATTPFSPNDLALLRGQAHEVLRGYVPAYEAVFRARHWTMQRDIERVYVSQHARAVLNWRPQYDFARAIDDLAAGRDPRSPLARKIGSKGYHRER